MSTPIQVVVTRDPNDRETDVYVDALRLAFEGSSGAANSPSTYLDDSVDLGIRVLEPARRITDQDLERLLGGARHTIVVAIGVLPDLTDRIEARVGSENVVRVPAPLPPLEGELQGEKPSDGVEPALAPVVVALQTMQRARRILAHDLQSDEDPDASLKLFISHAKVDGVAMARSLIGILRQLQEADCTAHGFACFYDAEHIRPGELWRNVLDTEAKRSVLIALRTEAYESRIWCRREFLAAECNGMPILAVDLRRAQYQSSALLPFELVPTVRVHDGNVIRVVLHAMAAHLRVLRMRSIAPKGVRVLPHSPSVYSLDGIRKAANTEKIDVVAYPGPKLPIAYSQAVEPILNHGSLNIDLVSFDELENT